MRPFKDGPLSNAHSYISMIMSRALKEKPILNLRATVDDPHELITAWTLPTIWNHSFSEHPLDTSLELLSDSENLQIPLKAELNHISLDHLLEAMLTLSIMLALLLS